MKFGYKASAEQFGPKALLDFACLAEQLGFDSLFISDHFQPWRHSDGHAPFSLSWLGAAGARTARIQLGTSVLTPSFRYHPTIVAQAFATLGSLYPDRMILGVGTGEALNEVPATAMTWPPFKERAARLRESVALIRALWRADRVSFQGDYYRTLEATIYDKPAAEIPIFVSAAGPKAARMAGEIGDGYICTSGKDPALYREKLLPNVASGLEVQGKSIQDIELMIELKVSFDSDLQRAREDTRHWAALALSPEEKLAVKDPMEMERLADSLPIERAASRWIVSSDPEAQVEQIEPYVDLGFRHLVFHAPGPDQERFLRLYAAEVLPLLRARFG